MTATSTKPVVQLDLTGRAAVVTGDASGIGLACARSLSEADADVMVASPFKAGYVCAKHALEGMSKVVALEAGEHGVTSNCVNPGYVRTPLVEKQIADRARAHNITEDEVLQAVFFAMSSVKRLATVTEVAELFALLCSSAASYVNGASLTMDGGGTAR